MLTSGLTNTPISKLLLIYTIAASIALSILDIKHLAPLHVSPHLFPYGQFWRAAVWPVAGFTNSTEALFAAMLAYHLRVVERAWGKRKMASFVLSTALFTTFLPPLFLSLLHVLSRGRVGYLPSGPTATLFAMLAQYHAMVPGTFRYRISTSTSTSTSSTSGQGRSQHQPQDTNTTTDRATGANTEADADTQGNSLSKSLTLNLSDKSTTYLVAAQLALSQFPAMLLPAAVGWFVGVAWRAEFLPGSAWRVPAWVVGEKDVGGWRGRGTRRGTATATATATGTESGEGGYENLRRRLEGEAVAAAAAAAAASGNAGVGAAGGVGGQRQRRVI